MCAVVSGHGPFVYEVVHGVIIVQEGVNMHRRPRITVSILEGNKALCIHSNKNSTELLIHLLIQFLTVTE